MCLPHKCLSTCLLRISIWYTPDPQSKVLNPNQMTSQPTAKSGLDFYAARQIEKMPLFDLSHLSHHITLHAFRRINIIVRESSDSLRKLLRMFK